LLLLGCWVLNKKVEMTLAQGRKKVKKKRKTRTKEKVKKGAYFEKGKVPWWLFWWIFGGLLP